MESAILPLEGFSETTAAVLADVLLIGFFPGIRLLRQGDKLGTSSACLLHTEGGIRYLSIFRKISETAAAELAAALMIGFFPNLL